MEMHLFTNNILSKLYQKKTDVVVKYCDRQTNRRQMAEKIIPMLRFASLAPKKHQMFKM